MAAKKKKVFELLELFENLSSEDSFVARPMFGCLALYIDGLSVAVLSESPEDKKWDGILVPTFFEHHEKLREKIPELISHPVLKKWLYLPRQTEDFEERVQLLVRMIRNRNPLIGVPPGKKKKRKKTRPTRC